MKKQLKIVTYVISISVIIIFLSVIAVFYTYMNNLDCVPYLSSFFLFSATAIIFWEAKRELKEALKEAKKMAIKESEKIRANLPKCMAAMQKDGLL